jgi:predicted LPLAT superfamily acyltransferase
VSSPAQGSGGAHWAEREERSNLWLLATMRWIAVKIGRRAARCVLHPITLYFLLVNGAARRASAQYLTRALGRQAGWSHVYRHIHCFASTILDRVYFLQGRFEAFDVHAIGTAAVDVPLAGGQGALMVGAHMGSFEALRAVGTEHGIPVAMLMYEDNARLINATLRAIAPDAQLRTIALGRPGAMLEVRDWLEQGGIAGLLGDRLLPGAASSERSRTVWLPFLGAPARFSDGPFRLAAMLRHRAIFMTGLYQGGNRYDLRFTELADFRERTPGGAAAQEERIQRAMRTYVALLESLCRESPYNWFNFFDFWATDADVSH